MPLPRVKSRPGPGNRVHHRLIALLAPLTTLGLATTRSEAADALTVAERFRQNHPATLVETGGWQLRPLVELRTGYTDNVEWRPDRKTGTPELALRGSIEASRESGLLEITLRGSHATTVYTSGPNRSANNTAASILLSLRPTAQVQLRASAGFEESAEPAPSNGIEIDGRWVSYRDFPQFERVPLGISLSVGLGRHRLDLEGTSTYRTYDDLLTISGIPVSQDFRSGWIHELRARGTWTTHAALEAFVEAQLGLERYANPTADTDRFRLAIGTTFEPHPLLRTGLLVGYARQDYTIADGSSGLVFDGELTWYMSPLVTVTLDAGREFRGNVVTTASGNFSTEPATTDRIGIAADWEPLHQMLVSLQGSWTVDETETGNRRDTFFAVGLKAQYALTDRLQARLEVEHQSGESSVIGSVARNRISVGLSSPY